MFDFFAKYKFELVSLGAVSLGTCMYIMRLSRAKSTWEVLGAIKTRIDAKTVVITGANTGIGYETALELAKRGARVVLACRDQDKASRAVERIKLATGNTNITREYLDLASFDTVAEFADKFKRTYDNLDVLINNAGFCPTS